MKLLESLRGRLFIAGIVLLLSDTLFPWWSYRLAVGSAGRREESVLTLGLPGSPWFHSARIKQFNGDGSMAYTTSTTYSPISVSVVAAVAGIALFVVAARMRRETNQPPRTNE